MLEHGRIKAEDIGACILASISFASKIEDYTVPISRLLRKSREIKPPPSNEFVSQKNEVSSVYLVKVYEFQLASMCGFCLDTKKLHPLSRIDEFEQKLGLDTAITSQLKRKITDASYTHSAFCLLEEPLLILAALYSNMADMQVIEAKKGWTDILKFDTTTNYLVKKMAAIMEDVGDYVRCKISGIEPLKEPHDLEYLLRAVDKKEKIVKKKYQSSPHQQKSESPPNTSSISSLSPFDDASSPSPSIKILSETNEVSNNIPALNKRTVHQTSAKVKS